MARGKSASAPEPVFATVSTGKALLNIRQEPSIKAAVVRTVANGDQVQVAQDKSAPDGWTALSDGYTMTKYLI